MKSVLTSLGLIIFYPIWLICALASDIVALLTVPCDSQRFVNTYIQTIRNAQSLGKIWDPVEPEEQPSQSEVQKIGFTYHEEDAEIYGPVCKKS